MARHNEFEFRWMDASGVDDGARRYVLFLETIEHVHGIGSFLYLFINMESVHVYRNRFIPTPIP